MVATAQRPGDFRIAVIGQPSSKAGDQASAKRDSRAAIPAGKIRLCQMQLGADHFLDAVERDGLRGVPGMFEHLGDGLAGDRFAGAASHLNKGTQSSQGTLDFTNRSNAP